MVCLCNMQICGRYMLHPHNEEQRKEHSSECHARHDRLAALRHSQGVECCVCLERVLDKPTAAERKFGLLSCEHPFCLGCIRGWRSHHESGADTDTVRLLQHICLNVIFDTSQNCCLYHDLHARLVLRCSGPCISGAHLPYKFQDQVSIIELTFTMANMVWRPCQFRVCLK